MADHPAFLDELVVPFGRAAQLLDVDERTIDDLIFGNNPVNLGRPNNTHETTLTWAELVAITLFLKGEERRGATRMIFTQVTHHDAHRAANEKTAREIAQELWGQRGDELRRTGQAFFDWLHWFAPDDGGWAIRIFLDSRQGSRVVESDGRLFVDGVPTQPESTG